jgi:hypothetical protein
MRKLALLILLGTVGCGDSPSAPAPQPVQAAGVWRGNLRVTSGTGEPCVGAAFQSAAGVAFDYTLTVQQSGATLTGTSRSVATGIVCQLTGTAGTSGFVLTQSTCDAPEPRFFSCDTIFRDARPSTLTVNADISGNLASGNYVETYNVFVSGTTTSLGTASLNAQLSLTRQ